MATHSVPPSTPTQEARMPAFRDEGSALVTIAPELSVRLAQESSRGTVLYGTFINENVLQLGLDGYDLEGLMPDPNVIEDKKYLAYHPPMEELARVREQVQRLFAKSKKDNAHAYSTYVEEIDTGKRMGFAPAPILWTQDPLEVIRLGLSNLCVVVIPRGRQLLAIDGETQIAGRFKAWKRNAHLKEIVVPTLVAHGRTEDWARQTFHDVNVFGIKPNAALAIGMDLYDPATRVARKLADESPFLINRVNMTARQLGKRQRDQGEIVTIASLRGSVVTLSKGMSGIAIGTKPLPLEEAEIEELERQAAAWWNALAKHLGTQLLDEKMITSSPACLAALGAVGHLAFSRGEDPQGVVAKLARDVEWTKGDRWAGVAGKFTPKGAFSLGGAKENAYAVYAALTDTSAASYVQVRR